jgi:hypothetical protein
MIRDSPHSLEAALSRLNERTGFDGSAVVDWVAKLTRSVPKIDRSVRAMAWHWMAWADGYSWSGGTMCSLTQFGSASVIGFGVGVAKPDGVERTPEVIEVLRVPDGHSGVDVGHVGEGEHAHGVEQPQTARVCELAHDPAPLDLIELEPPGAEVGLVLAAERAVELAERLRLVDRPGVGPAGEWRGRGGQKVRARSDAERHRVAERGPIDELQRRHEAVVARREGDLQRVLAAHQHVVVRASD